MPNWYPGQNKSGWKVESSPFLMAQGFASQPPAVTAPGTAGPGTAVTNNTGYDVMVYLSATQGMGSVAINGIGILGSAASTITPSMVYLPANQTITVTYSGALTWRWQAV
jgi:hypothetical protein